MGEASQSQSERLQLHGDAITRLERVLTEPGAVATGSKHSTLLVKSKLPAKSSIAG